MAIIKNEKIHTRATFIIADINSTAVLCEKTCEELNLIKRIYEINCNADDLQELIEKYDDCFSEIGALASTHHITISKVVKPVIHPAQAKLKSELERMTKLGVIKRIRPY